MMIKRVIFKIIVAKNGNRVVNLKSRRSPKSGEKKTKRNKKDNNSKKTPTNYIKQCENITK